MAALIGVGVAQPDDRPRGARHPADPHQHLRRHPPGRPRHRRSRPRHRHDRVRDPAQGRDAAGDPDASWPASAGRRSRSSRRRRSRRLPACLTLGDFIINENVYGDNGVLAGAIVVALLALDARVLARRAAAPAHLERAEAAAPPDVSSDQTHTRRQQVRTKTRRGCERWSPRCAGARPEPRRRRLRQQRRQHQLPSSTEGGEGGGAIVSNPDNGKVSLTIGSKNFPEQEILGEIYAQALAAAGYKVEERPQPRLRNGRPARRSKPGQISGYPEYASTALTSFFGLEPEEVPADADRSLGKGERRIRKGRPDGVPADPVRQRQRGRHAEEDGRKVRPEDDLRPRRRLGKTDPLRLARVPPADRLPGRAGKTVRAQIQVVHTRSTSASATRSSKRARPTSRSSSPPIRSSSAERDKFVILEDDKEVFPAGNVIFVTKPDGRRRSRARTTKRRSSRSRRADARRSCRSSTPGSNSKSRRRRKRRRRT